MESGDSNDAYPGRIVVGEATREWSLRVDEKLAHRLQEEEIHKHLDGNRYRNELLRQSYPVAASLHLQAMDEANRKAHLAQQRVEIDARIAKEQQKLELQKARHKEGKLKRGTSHPPNNSSHSSNNNTTSSVSSGECEAGPSTSGAVPRRPYRAYSSDMERHSVVIEDCNANLAELEAALGIPKEQLTLEKERLLQEEKDAELARQLLHTDIRDPVEIADGELARRLQDREYERYQRSKEKRALRKQMERMATQRDEYQEQRPAELSDTYSHPHDSLTGGTDRIIPDIPPQHTNGYQQQQHQQQEDPYYMEPIHAQLEGEDREQHHFFNNNNNSSNSSNTRQSSGSGSGGSQQGSLEHKRAPPAPPKSHGRPRMAEPDPYPGAMMRPIVEDKERSKARCRQM